MTEMTLADAHKAATEMGWKLEALLEPIMGSYNFILSDDLGERWCKDLADVEQKLVAARKLAEAVYPGEKDPSRIIFARA